MPPELLPEVPDLEALGKLFQKKVDLEIGLRRAILLFLGVQFAFDDKKVSDAIVKSLRPGGGRDAAGLFLGRRPQDAIQELFTLDLKAIVSGNWNTFSVLFEENKARFEMNMDSVNRARRFDSHTKPITPSDIEEFENSFQWLLARLRKVPAS